MLKARCREMKDDGIDNAKQGLRVAIFTAAWWKLDGVTLTLRKIVRYLKKTGVHYRIYTTNACIPDTLNIDEKRHICIVPDIDLPFWETSQGYKMGMGLPPVIQKDVLRFKPDIMHVSVPDVTGRDVVKWSKHQRIPLMATWHSNYPEYMLICIPWPFSRFLAWGIRSYLINLFSQVPTTYVPTEFTRQKLIKEGYKIAGVNRLKVWGRGVNTQLFNPRCASGEFRAKHNIHPDAIVILWVGRVVKEKGTEIYAKCMERFNAENANVCGLVIGSGTELKRLSSLPNVKCAGWVFSENLGEAYASCDILLFPSAVETFGNVTLEAMACGLPAVVDNRCSAHLVDHGKHGFLVPSGDLEGYYSAVKSLVCDSQLRAKMGARACQKASAMKGEDLMREMVQNYKDEIVFHRKNGTRSPRMFDIGYRGLGWYLFEWLIEIVEFFFMKMLWLVRAMETLLIQASVVSERKRPQKRRVENQEGSKGPTNKTTALD